MGVTPDDIVQCECCGVGVIEVKCPFCVSRKAFTQMLLRIIVFLHHDSEGTLSTVTLLPGRRGVIYNSENTARYYFYCL